MHGGSSPSPSIMNNPQKFEHPERLGIWFQAFLMKYNGALDPYLLTSYLKTNLSITRFSQQNENELAFILSYLYYRREEIEHYIEIGVHKGGTFFVIDQFLRQVAKNYKHGVAVDGWYKTFTEFGLLDYKKLVPETVCINKDLRKVSSESYPSKGAVFFIDCDHTYELTLEAFERTRKQALFVFLDDVGNLRYPEMQVLWKQIQQKYCTKYINTMHLKLCNGNGIGLILNPKRNEI